MQWQSEWDFRLKQPQQIRELLNSLESEPASTFDMLFYAAFVHKLIPIIQKADSQAEGYSRMQQSFTEAVEKVRSGIVRAGELGFSGATQFTDLSHVAMASLMDLIHDLATVKQNQKAE